jgi:cell division initiation protein
MSYISPIEIRKKSFDKKTFGGYSQDDVDAFLQNLSQAWQDNNAQQERLQVELSVTKTELDRMRSLESELLQGLKDAKQISQQLLSQSRKEAELTMYEAKLKAEQVLADAKQQARLMVQEANQQAYQALIAMRAELKQLDNDYKVMEKQREILVYELRQFVTDTMHKLDKVEANKRTTSYQDEIQKANFMMQQNNETVKSYLRENTQKIEGKTQQNTQQHTQEPKPIQENASFFDTI